MPFFVSPKVRESKSYGKGVGWVRGGENIGVICGKLRVKADVKSNEGVRTEFGTKRSEEGKKVGGVGRGEGISCAG